MSMPIDFSPYSLADYFLIATPNLDDTYFSQSLVYICEHNAAGALGLRVNEPLDISIDELLHRMHIDTPLGSLGDMPVLNGGPMQSERGFVLHEPQKRYMATLFVGETPQGFKSNKVSGRRALSTSKDILDSLGSDEAPEHFLLTLGYCAWGQGQLEGEIADNDWLTVSAAKAGADVLWHTPPAGRWAAAMKLLGVQAWQISAKAGRA